MVPEKVSGFVGNLVTLGDAGFSISYVIDEPKGMPEAELARGIMRFADRVAVGELADGDTFVSKDSSHRVRSPQGLWREDRLDSDGPHLVSPFWYLDVLLGIQDVHDAGAQVATRSAAAIAGRVDIVLADELSPGGVLAPSVEALRSLRSIETLLGIGTNGLLRTIRYRLPNAVQTLTLDSYGCARQDDPRLAEVMPPLSA